MGKIIKSKTVSYKLMMAFAALAMFQSIMTAVFLMGAGVMRQTRGNQYRIFSEKVDNRKNILESQMRDVWVDFGRDAELMENSLRRMERDGMGEDETLRELSSGLTELLYHTRTTGAFLILADGAERGACSGLYLRNNNPGSGGDTPGNTYMLVGPWSVAEDMGIPTMANWTYRLELTKKNGAFVTEPCRAARELGKSRWLGYWSEPFQINGENDEILTYSIPLFDGEDQVTAVLGVEISIQYLYEFLPFSELQPVNSYGYLIGTRRGVERTRGTIMRGALQNRALEKNDPLEMEAVSEENDIYRLNTKTDQELYACVKEMELYGYNTPFGENTWYLVGLMQKKDLLEFPARIERILMFCSGISTVLSLAAAVFLSRWFTRNARLMEMAGLPVGVVEFDDHSDFLRMTGGVPRLLNLTKEQERDFALDKYKFLAFLTNVTKEGQKDILRVESGGKMRWILVTRKREKGVWRYVFEDDTEDILRTRMLQQERDLDALTGIRNRMAFKKLVEEKNKSLTAAGRLGIIMCDLNNLKYVNDHFGHHKGDEYLLEFTCKLQGSFPGETLFRIGGDEFVVVTENMTGAQAERGIERMERRMADYSAGCEYRASAAMGFALYDPERDGSLEDTLARADQAMYLRKKAMKAEGGDGPGSGGETAEEKGEN